jgi:hypothetical protein
LKNNLLETRKSDSSNGEAGSGTSIKQTKTNYMFKNNNEMIEKKEEEKKTL